MAAEDKEGEILNMKLLLRDVAYEQFGFQPLATFGEFKCYSANDIKKLIASKRSKALKQLYELEEAYNLRSSFSVARATEAARSQASATEATED